MDSRRDPPDGPERPRDALTRNAAPYRGLDSSFFDEREAAADYGHHVQ
jgi:hypothetical protein